MSLNITDAIFARAEQMPHVAAIIDAGIIVDYRSLCAAVNRAARQIRQSGWKAGDIVGISVSGTPALHLIAALALARLGIIQVSLPPSESPALRLARVRRLGIRGVISDNEPPAGLDIPHLAARREWLQPEIASGAESEDIREPGGSRLWIINETSGTTAEPKVIGLSHDVEDMHRRMRAPIFAHLPGERYLNLSGLRFLTGMKRAICCLSEGGTLTLPAGLNMEGILNWIDRHHVTYLSCVPMHLHQMLRSVATSAPRLPSLRILLSSSAALPLSAVHEVRKRISPQLHINYGITEAGPIVSATPVILEEYPDAAGLPLAGVEFEIVDDNDKAVPCGTIGHVRVRGPSISTSYLHADAAAQARAFRSGWFYPGDLALKNSSGVLFHKGRSDEVMNYDGIMVGPNEIESVLRLHPSVIEVAAFALPSLEHQDIPAAAIVSSGPLDADELTRYCAERLGVRAPRVFLQIMAIPKNPVGKVLRQQLTALALQKLPKQTVL